MGHKVKKPRDYSQFKNPGGRRSPKHHKVKTQLGNYIIPHKELWPVPQTPELDKER